MNPTLKQLGFAPHDRVVIIHADDIGMCQATLPAIADLFEFGLVSSAAVMVPCAWFPQTAAFCRANPGIDMGVHLTVNCEWQAYRWAPLATCDPASGLIDAQGYMHADPAATEQQADPPTLAVEMRAQLTRALAAGIDATHIDAHMGTVMRPPFVEAYLELALEHQLPPFFIGHASAKRMRLHPELLVQHEQIAQALVARGAPLFDDMAMLPLNDPADPVGRARQIIDSLQPGLSVLVLHPAQDTPELRALAPDWPSRVANYQACMSSELRDYVRHSGVQVIGYRALRDVLRKKGELEGEPPRKLPSHSGKKGV